MAFDGCLLDISYWILISFVLDIYPNFAIPNFLIFCYNLSMEPFLNRLRYFNHDIFYFFQTLDKRGEFWQQLFYFFSRFGIVIIVLILIYLVLRQRIIILFASVLSTIFSVLLSFIFWLLWHPQPFLVYWNGSVTVSTFPSGFVYLSFAVATTLLFFSNKKTGLAALLTGILIAISQIADGLRYPTAAIIGIAIGIFAGTLTYWFMEHFENFWANNSAE
ncbi:hypothetical protein COT12_03265 [Candidatus Berkelbacteria bacterium CG08_land_8_20_14_0_20_39_8]|uniref:Uncharacterized protein n=1 Tax=Candidatus Berkelbacteria bacterium CG08_land_8_20_14_0_20_39_8 TaxID=1974511 RepID=A0A2M6YBE8_9BACT|nr:MAG: hypothetical protein COT12_03265 [Candidatus Berkelbacteria bacterium CG08_land_8_20_14_0_20_39_8]